MKSRLGTIVCIILGSFCVYCGQTAMNVGTGHGRDAGLARDGSGPVGDAHAQSSGGTCCSAPGREQPSVIFDDVVATTAVTGNDGACTQLSPVFDVSGYRTIVIHTTACEYSVQFRNGKAGFVYGGGAESCGTGLNTQSRAITIDPILGHDMRINFGASQTTDNPDGEAACGNKSTLTVVGYQNP